MSDQIHQGFQEAKGASDGDLSRDFSRTLGETASSVAEHKVSQMLQRHKAQKAEAQQPIIQTAECLLNSDGVSIGAQSQPSQNRTSLPRRIINYRGIVDSDNRAAVAVTLGRIKDRVIAISSPNQPSKSSQNRDNIPKPPPYDSSQHFLYGETDALEDISCQIQDSPFITDSSREQTGVGSSELTLKERQPNVWPSNAKLDFSYDASGSDQDTNVHFQDSSDDFGSRPIEEYPDEGSSLGRTVDKRDDSIVIHEFSTGVKPLSNGDGGWVSGGYTGAWINSSFEDGVPSEIERVIEDKQLAPPAEYGAIKEKTTFTATTETWAVVAVVDRATDDKGIAFSMSRYYAVQDPQGIETISAFLKEREAQGYPVVADPLTPVSGPHVFTPPVEIREQPRSNFFTTDAKPVSSQSAKPYPYITNTDRSLNRNDSELSEDTERVTSVADAVLQGGHSYYTDTHGQVQKNVVSVPDAIVPPTEDQRSVNTDVDLSEAVTQRRYEGDEVSITRTGNIVEIYQDSELVFKYKYENGRPKVLKDEITGRQNPYLEEKFNNIHNRMVAAAPVPEHRPSWIRQVLSDKTGQSQVTNLGPLAPKGSKAIATANMLTTEDMPQKVIIDNGQIYRYIRTSTKDEAGKLQVGWIVTSGDGSIIARSTGNGIEGSAQTSEDFSRVAKHYEKVKAQVIERNAASKAKPQDKGGR